MIISSKIINKGLLGLINLLFFIPSNPSYSEVTNLNLTEPVTIAVRKFKNFAGDFAENGIVEGANGEKIRDGFRVSIIGETNVGKSSLLNLLSKRDAAIVSDEAGTTRDVIETYLNLEGYPVILADTAGIREAKNDIENHVTGTLS